MTDQDPPSRAKVLTQAYLQSRKRSASLGEELENEKHIRSEITRMLQEIVGTGRFSVDGVTYAVGRRDSTWFLRVEIPGKEA